MNPEREQLLREISTLFGVRFGRLVELVESQHVPQDDSRDAQIVYAFNKAERVIALERALQMIIDMNRMHARDQYGDADKAESWSCVTVARAALNGDSQ